MGKRLKLKLVCASVSIGLIVGLLDYLFGSVLLEISDFRSEHFNYLIPWLPVVGLVIVFCYQRYGKEAGKGMSLLFEIHQNKKENIPAILVPLIVLSTWLTHLFGGSAGREGVAVQIGGTIGNKVYQRLPVDNQTADTKQLFLMMGMAAGFGGLFQTPLAATAFAFEVFRTKTIKLNNIIFVLAAALISDFTTSTLGLEKFTVQIPHSQAWWQPLNYFYILKWLLLMLSLYAIGKLFALVLKKVKVLVARMFINPYIKMAVCGVILAMFIYFIGHGRYSGLGTNLINEAFYQTVTPYDWILKLIFTILTLSIGFQGGEVTPLFSIGASFAHVLAYAFGLPTMPAVALGYIGVFSSASHTFITAVFLSYEIFGWQVVPLAIIQALVFYLIKQEISIYPMKATKIKN